MNKLKLICVWLLFLSLGMGWGTPLHSKQPCLKGNPHNIIVEQEVVLGNPQAPVVIICYSSFTCLHCAQFHLKVFPFLKQKYIDTGRAFYIMRDYPLDGISLKASQLARAEGVSNYIKNAEVFYYRQKEWITSKNPEKILQKLVKAGGASEQDIQNILKNKDVLKIILSQRLEAQKKLGITHTPTFIINGRKVEGYMSFEQLEKYLEEAENC
ncbi:MAG: DsbA family protein [Proteobacteria bacterium]|nr:DsbA family protein [Pseudomonadota bacterium]